MGKAAEKTGRPAEKEKQQAAGMDGQQKEKGSGTVVYVGSTIKGVLTHNTIYSDGIPAAAEKEAEKLPVLEKLFVPAGMLPMVNKQMQQGGAYKEIYDKALSGIKEGTE